MNFNWDEIDAELREAGGCLDGIEIDRTRIEQHAREIRAGRLGPESNRVSSKLGPPGAADVDRLADIPLAIRKEYTATGRRALERGEVAVAVLNGGMATRFGGAVKGIVESVEGQTFLELKHAQGRSRGAVPFLVMTSFATHGATLDYLERRRLPGEVRTFMQSVSLRLTREGELFRDNGGRISPYAPGHGDFPEALRRSGLVGELESRSVRAVMLSNVDNLGADPDPLVVGYHLSHGCPLTVEVAPSIPNDAGGGPARVGGRLQILESFRLPEGFDLGSLPFVSTNTLIFSLPTLAHAYPLTWFYVEKKVDGSVAVQMERLVGQISEFVDAAYLLVARDGPEFRYFPVKRPEDLDALRADPVKVARIRASVGDVDRL
jgi:UTP--glucose-1-phosphate uridylyltransferase